MFSRKVPNTVLYTNPNLKSVISMSNFTNVFRNLSSVKNKMKVFATNGTVLQALRNTFVNIPKTLKDQSRGVLRVWAHQCECVLAQRLRRGQQMFCLYTRLWEERALKALVARMREQITKRGKELVYGAIGVIAYDWETNRITRDELIKHMNELDFIHTLTKETMCCAVCEKGPCDSKIPSINHCMCSTRGTERKTYDNWAPFIERKDMVVWRREHNSGHYEYKVYGSFDDVTAEDFLNVQIDNEYRKKWDTTAITLEVVEKDPHPQSNSDIIYWEMLWPKLFTNRDYVFNRRFTVDSKNKTIIIINKGTRHPACPIKPDKHRVETYWSYMVIKPYSELNTPGLEFGLTYFDNPGVNIPAAVTTWVAMRAMPDFLERLRDATKGYKIYCKQAGNPFAYNLYTELKRQDRTEEEKVEREDIIIDDTIFELQPIITRRSNNEDSGLCSNEVRKPEEKKLEEKSTKISGSTPGLEVMTSPSPIIQADSNKNGYWKYLHPTYYFS